MERTPILRSPFDPLRDHWGADYPGTTGENVHPVASGIVTEIGFDLRELRKPNPRSGLTVRGWGRYVVITHEDGSQTLYAHLVPESTAHLSKGQAVSPSTVMGQLGSSGGATGPHLHLQYSPEGRIRAHDSLVDPDPCIEAGLAPPEPLVLSPQNPTFSCSNPTLTFTATGGTLPYTWSTTKGLIIPSADTASAELKPPDNKGKMVEGNAYRTLICVIQPEPEACVSDDPRNFQRCSTTAPQFGCNDQLNQFGGCATGPCEVGTTCEDFIAQNGGSLNCGGTEGIFSTCGQVNDVRTPDMIKNNCLPCRLEMQGATVTVKDANPNQVPVTTTITVQ